MSNQFWSSPQSDPKRNYRFYAQFGDLPHWVATKVSLPAYKLGEAKHSYLNHTFKYPGRIEWEDVTLSLRDPVNPDSSQTIMKILTDSGYFFPDAQFNLGNFATVSKRQAINAIGNKAMITQVDGEGAPITIWTLHNAWVKDFKPGELDYSSDELVELSLTITYDWATRI